MREKILTFVRGMLGVLYIWGGSSRKGVDCSGLLELATNLLAPGKFPGRQTAAEWFNILPPVQNVKAGDLCFWSAGGKVYHVAVVEELTGGVVKTIGAHGGNSKTTTPEIAKAKGAQVKRLSVPMKRLAGYRTWPGEVDALPNVSKVLSTPPHSNEPPEDWV